MERPQAHTLVGMHARSVPRISFIQYGAVRTASRSACRDPGCRPADSFFAHIPDITTLEIPPLSTWCAALGIAGQIRLWTGPDGRKTDPAQTMALAVSRGAEFLGMACQQAPVLYVDLENPGYVVQERLQALIL